jgi:hypothetical protein
MTPHLPQPLLRMCLVLVWNLLILISLMRTYQLQSAIAICIKAQGRGGQCGECNVVCHGLGA